MTNVIDISNVIVLYNQVHTPNDDLLNSFSFLDIQQTRGVVNSFEG